MNIVCVKEEELNQQSTTASIPKTFLSNIANSHDGKLVKTYLSVYQKFTKALYNLQVAQVQNQRDTNPKYPFVLYISPNEIMVHLGSHTVNMVNRKELCQFQSQLHIQHNPPKVNHSHQPSIKLSIQKRRGIAIQDQKDTKNIPKNYCKAIITFASKNQNLCLLILKDQLKVVKFLDRITQYKKSLMNIRIFSSLLTQSDDPEEEEFNRTFRILSRIFVQKFAINYIFNSKIVQHNWHLRYRYQIYKGIKSPRTFSHIKNL